jgi:hypothetical protein
MSRRNGNCELWPVTKTTWHRKWGVWFAGEVQYSKDLKELLDIIDI